MSATQHGNQTVIPGEGLVCMPNTSQNNTILPGFGLVNDFNDYQSASTTPLLIGYPS